MVMAEQLQPLIIGFVTDLMATTRIENSLRDFGLTIEFIQDANQINPSHEKKESPPKEAEFLFELINFLTEKKPSLIIFDLSVNNLPWHNWLLAIKKDPATRRIPVLAYGFHINKELLKIASDLGADRVVPRSQFLLQLSELVSDMIVLRDPKDLIYSCSENLSTKAIDGLLAFNQKEFFEAHELLEQAWMEDSSPARNLYRAILQVAVAYYQVQNGNYRGALKMFIRLRQWLDPLPSTCRGVNVTRLKEDSFSVYQMIRHLGPDGIKNFDQSLFTEVEFHGG